MPVARLYELTTAYARLLEAEDPAEFTAALDQLAGDIAEKVEGIAVVIRQLEVEETAFRSEAERLLVNARFRANRIASLKQYLQENLERAGQDRVMSGLFTVTLQASPPSVRVIDAAAVPDRFQRVVPSYIEVDKAAVLAHWRETHETPSGVEITQGRYLRIR